MSKRIYSTIVAFVILVGGYSNSNAENVNGLSAGESMMNNADTVKSKVVTKEKTVEGIEFLDDVITYRSKTEKNPTGLKIKKGRVAIKADCDKKTYRFNMPDVSESITIGSPWVEYEEPCQDIVPAQYIKKADFAARTRKVAVLYNAYSDIKLGKIYIFKPIMKEESDIAVMPIRITDANATLYTKINDGKDSVVEKMAGKIVYAIGKYTARGNVDFDAFMYNGEEILTDSEEDGRLYINPQGKCFVQARNGGSKKPVSKLFRIYEIPNYSLLGWIYPNKIVLDETIYVLSRAIGIKNNKPVQ